MTAGTAFVLPLAALVATGSFAFYSRHRLVAAASEEVFAAPAQAEAELRRD